MIAPPEERWLSTAEFGRLAGISDRAARLAMQRCLTGGEWRGARLIVKGEIGHRGRSGLNLKVRADSLPAELRQCLSKSTALVPASAPARPASIDWSRRPAPPPGREPRWKELNDLIQPALWLPRRSRERADAIAAIVAESGKSRQQVRRLIDAYEARGVAGLARKPRVDAGRAKWPISRAWQSLCDAHSIGAATRAEIVSKLEQFVRNNWRSDGPGWRIVAQDATFELMVLMRAAGVDLPGDKLRAACRVSRSFVERWRAYANPAIVGRDAKRVYDRHEPIVRRSRDGMLPMECIAGDVHPIDIRCRRDDGSVAHARMIAWVDAATWRAFVSLVLLEKGRGIRQEHVILSFVEMVEAWGLPAGLYLDNGGEYNWTRLVDDAMRLNAMAIEVAGDRSPTRRSLPYNGRSKLIETFFSSFEGLYLRRIHGWVGGDRMRAKTANVGKAPPVFEGTFEELNTAVAVALAAYHATPQRGHLDGRSPNPKLPRSLG